MAPVVLNVAPGLRPWRQAGIAHVLVDAPLAQTLRAAVRPAPAAALGADAASPRSRTVASAPRNEAPRQPSAMRGVVPEKVFFQSGADQPAVARTEGPQPASTVWPETWQSLWEQAFASGGRPAAVWTYAELGMDMRGQADAGRRRALQSLIADLGLPKGSHAFWPYSLPPDNIPSPEMFLAGLDRFKPGLVLLAGPQATGDLSLLGPLPSVSLQIAACRGFRFMLLPTLAEFAELAGPRREQLLAFIKAAVA